MLKLRAGHQMTVWDCLLPDELRHLNDELTTVGKLLDDQIFMAPFLEKWNIKIGRPTVAVETYLRLMYLKYRYGFGYETLVAEVNDSLQWRQFCRIPLDKRVPHSTTLIKLTQKYGDETIHELNKALIEKATQEKIIRTRKMRTDTTVVESNIHYPTDSQILADGIKAITRQAKKIRQVVGATIPAITDRCRSTKKKILAIAKVLKNRTGEAVEKVREITEELVDKAIETVFEAHEVLNKAEESLAAKASQSLKKRIEKLEQMVQITDKIIDQTLQVSHGKKHISDRVVSVHDPDARPIQKGKLRKPTEFGYKVEITENEDRIVTDFKVHVGNPSDESLLIDAVKRHIEATGVIPEGLAADRGYSSKANEDALKELGVKRVSIPKRGKKSAARIYEEKQRWFRELQRYRAGGEGTISVLKRSYGLNRSLSRGHRGTSAWVGFGILAYNLKRITALK